MGISYKSLGQVNSDTTEQLLFQTTSSVEWVTTSSIIVCNTTSQDATFNVSVRDAFDGSTTAKNRIFYLVPIKSKETISLLCGITVTKDQGIYVVGSVSGITFNLSGAVRTNVDGLKYKMLGQNKPSAGVLTDIETVASSRSWLTSSIIVCNTGSAQTSFRLALAPAGQASTNKHFLFYDTQIDAYETKEIGVGLTAAATDVIRGYSVSGNVSFSIFGAEIQ